MEYTSNMSALYGVSYAYVLYRVGDIEVALSQNGEHSAYHPNASPST